MKQKIMSQEEINTIVPPICEYAKKGDIESVKVELAKGEDINITDSGFAISRWTALHYATSYDQVEVVKLLIRHGANLNQVDHFSKTPLHVALFTGSYNSAEVLVKSGARKDIKDDSGMTASDMIKQKLTKNRGCVLIPK